MATNEATENDQLLPLLDYLARVGVEPRKRRNLAVDATRAMFFLVPGAYCDAPTMSVSGECLELGEGR